MLVSVTEGDHPKEVIIGDQDITHTHTPLSRLQNSTATHRHIHSTNVDLASAVYQASCLVLGQTPA